MVPVEKASDRSHAPSNVRHRATAGSPVRGSGCVSCRSPIDLDKTQVLVFRGGRIVRVRCVLCETEWRA